MDEAQDNSGSIILGISDALIEITGILVALTFALNDMHLIALTGMVTGVAASFSMAASEYLSKKTEGGAESPLHAAASTWGAYISVVLVLVAPYGIINQAYFGIEEHLFALGLTLVLGIVVVAVFNAWVSINKGTPFYPAFVEMLVLLSLVIIISYGIGQILGTVFVA